MEEAKEKIINELENQEIENLDLGVDENEFIIESTEENNEREVEENGSN